MKDLETFKNAVKEYTRQVQRKSDGKTATMEDLAVTIGFTREALSKKLNGKTPLDARDVRNIVRGLARLDAITSRSQARRLLELMNAPDFEPVDWDAEPLNKLISKSKADEPAPDPPLIAPTTLPPLPSASIALPAKHFQASASGFLPQRKWLLASFLLLLIGSAALYVLPRYHITISAEDACPLPHSTDTVKDIYAFTTCNSRQVVADPLHERGSYAWDQNDHCFFSGGAYHVFVPKTDFVTECFAQKAPLFSDFALQVDMTILQGGSGGLLFRAENTDAHDTNAIVYRVPIDVNGSYNFYLGRDLPCKGPPVSSN